MTKREALIEELTKGISLKDKQKLSRFWSGKGTLSGTEYIRFANILEEFDKKTKGDSTLRDFLQETRRAYKKI